MTRNVFEHNESHELPEEIEPYMNQPFAILPALESEYDYKLISLADGRSAVVIDRKEYTDVHQAWASHPRDREG